MQTYRYAVVSILLGLLFCAPVTGVAADAAPVSLSGTVQSLVCTQSCGSCCGTHGLTDTSGNISLQIGNSFADLAKIADDGQVHQINGYFYTAAGQCGVNECSLFAVETIDQPNLPAAIFQPASGRLSIQAVVIDGDADKTRYLVDLDPPYTVASAIDHNNLEIIAQGGDCSATNAVCSNGSVCLSYFGIGGASGPQFKTCEVPCSHAGASCPLGQSCATIADGPGQVCTAD